MATKRALYGRPESRRRSENFLSNIRVADNERTPTRSPDERAQAAEAKPRLRVRAPKR